MATHHTHSLLENTILLALKTTPECELDEILTICSGFTWNQVFCAVDQLSRSGDVHLTRHRATGYTLSLTRNIVKGRSSTLRC